MFFIPAPCEREREFFRERNRHILLVPSYIEIRSYKLKCEA